MHMTTANSFSYASILGNPWHLDTVASHYIAMDLSVLSIDDDYHGFDQVSLAKDHGMSISHSNNAQLCTHSCSFFLSNILRVP